MKKILLYTECFYNGGIEKVIYHIYNHFTPKYNIDVISLNYKKNIYDIKVNKLLKYNYPINIIRNIIGIFKFNNYLKNKKYDIIHIHCYNAIGNIYGYIALKYSKHVIIHAHDCNISNDYFKIKTLINKLFKIIYNPKITYLAVSDSSSKFCFNKRIKYSIINNGIPYNKYYFNKENRNIYRKQFNFKDNDIVIGNIGRLCKVKNQKLLLKIFIKLNKIKDNYYLVLIGFGNKLNKLKRIVKKHNLENKVFFLGNRTDISELLSMMDIYVSCALFEAFGLSLVESQISGLPVYAPSNISKNIIITKNINLINIENQEEIIKRIINTKLNHRNNFKIKKTCDIKNFVNNIDKVYKK